MKFFRVGVFVFFSSFDYIFRLTCFVFDFDDIHFCTYKKMGDTFPRAFLGVRQQIQKIGR